MLATLSLYSTADAGPDAASAATRPVTTNTNVRLGAVIDPPGREMGKAPGIIPSRRPGRERMQTALRSGVEVFAGRGRGPAHSVPLLAQQELVEPDRAAFER